MTLTVAPCSYSRAHVRLFQRRGSASAHSCVRCGAQAHQWAYQWGSEREQVGTRMITKKGREYTINTRWSPDPADYEPMCRSCHRTYDLANPDTAKPGRRLYVTEGKVTFLAMMGLSPQETADVLDVDVSNVYRAIARAKADA